MEAKAKYKRRRVTMTVLATGLMVVLAIFTMLPFTFMFLSSLKPGQEMLRKGLSLTFEPGISSFKNYAALNTYRDGIYWQWYKSSVSIMFLQTATGLFFGSLVGYGLAMYDFRGKNLIFTLVLIVMMIPFEILLLPLYRMLIRARLTDTYIGVVMPYLVPPFMVFFFRQYVLGLPKELLRKNADRAIHIPMGESQRSLNLSNSVAIVLYEALRQNNFLDLV